MTGLESSQFAQTATWQIKGKAGSVVDQVALYRSINRMRDLGLPPISVGRV